MSPMPKSLNKNSGEILQYLVGLSDQLADVHLGVGCFIVISHWGLLHCWRQRAVFVCDAIKESETTPSERDNHLHNISVWNTPALLSLYSHRLVEDGDGLGVVVAADQSLHVVVQHRQAELQDGFDAIVEETVHHVHGAFYGQDADEEREKPGQRHGREETQVRHVLHQLGEVFPNQILEHRLVDQSAWGKIDNVSECKFVKYVTFDDQQKEGENVILCSISYQ